MLVSTPGIVLATTPYAETSLIVRIFTRRLGCRTYIAKGARSKASSRVSRTTRRIHILLQPMNCLDLTVYEDSRKNINHIKDMAIDQQYPLVTTNNVRRSLLFFLNELIYKALQTDDANPDFYDFIIRQLDNLEHCTSLNPCLPLTYLLGTAHYLGIAPLNNYSPREPLFNLNEGRYQATPSSQYLIEHPTASFLSPQASLHLHQLLSALQHATPLPTLTANDRQHLINSLLIYYNNHLSGFRNFRSHLILHELLH